MREGHGLSIEAARDVWINAIARMLPAAAVSSNPPASVSCAVRRLTSPRSLKREACCFGPGTRFPEVTPPRCIHGGEARLGGGQSPLADNRHHMNVLVDRKLPEQQPGARDNTVLCVPSMGSEDRLTACLFR